jgi:hypothetical protein
MKPKNPKNKPATKAELARQLGISRQLLAWHAKQPDAPTDIGDVAAWQFYLADQARDAGLPVKHRLEISRQRARWIEQQANRAERENKLAEKGLIPLAEVKAEIAQAVGILFAGLEAAFAELPLMLEGMSAVDIGRRLTTTSELLKAELRRAAAKIAGEIQDEQSAVQAARAIIDRQVFAAVGQIAFAERIESEYNTFKRWFAGELELRQGDRERWLKSRAEAGLPVPNATPDEQLKFKVGTRES